jgi:subtilisin-like proprotein convertase family protein
MTAGSCDFCDDFGSCGDGGDCPANIDPVNNAICVESMDESQELVAGPGLAAAIGDDDYDGTIGTMTCVTLPLAASGPDTVTGVQLELGMVHSWIGDLTIKVFSPEGTAVTVLSRPGAVEASDDGVPLLGDSSNLAISSPLSYLNGGATDAEVMGSTIGDGQVVCADDTLCAYAPNPGAAVAGDFSAFVGESAVGNWQVCVGDGGPGDLGSIDAVTLTVDQGA